MRIKEIVIESIMNFDNGFRIVKFQSRNFRIEKNRRNNVIYSLRDKQNKPLVTIEVDPDPDPSKYNDRAEWDYHNYGDIDDEEFEDPNKDGRPRVIQIRDSKHDDVDPKKKYFPYIRDFISQSNFFIPEPEFKDAGPGGPKDQFYYLR